MDTINTQLLEYKHHISIQIRFKDIDKLGHVNNANHLTYFEMARVDYFDAIFKSKINWNGLSMILAKTEINYKKPILLDDNLLCYTKISKIGNKSFDVEHLLVIKNNEKIELCATGKTVVVCYNYVTEETVQMPKEWADVICGFENLPEKQ